MLCIGMRLKHEVDANIRTLAGKLAFTAEDKKLLADYGEKAMSRKPMKDMRVE
jgi:hypothetical protein